MTPDIQAQLAQLRDIRSPHEIGLWPLAPGWWMVVAFMVVAVLGFISWRVLRRYGARYLALAELDALRTDDDPQRYATELSTLMRRVARRKDEAVAKLSGRSWAAYLTDTGLEATCASYLAEATYAAQPVATASNADLRDEAKNWIRRQT